MALLHCRRNAVVLSFNDNTSVYKVLSNKEPYNPHTPEMFTLTQAAAKPDKSIVSFRCLVKEVRELKGQDSTPMRAVAVRPCM